MGFLASLMFFTRLPWWRLATPPKEAFEQVVDWWPLVGWLTGGVMAAVFGCTLLLGCAPALAALLAIAARLLLTGALHEDGLADFCDGFGGGTTRERTLDIMKDSHIGTYGVLGLILWFALLWSCMAGLISLPGVHQEAGTLPADSLLRASLPDSPFSAGQAAVLLLLFDVTAKSAASLITGQLPYARTAEGAKNQVVYAGRSLRGWLGHSLRCVAALSLPTVLCCSVGLSRAMLLLPVPFLVEYLLMRWMRRRLGGYTGDCCGALFLLCELSLYVCLAAVS